MTQDGDDLTTAQRDWWRQCGAATAAMLLPVLGCLAYAGGLPKLPDYVREAMQAALVVLAALVLGAVPAARLLPAQPLWFLLGAMACGYAVLSLAGLLLGVAGLLYVPILLALPAAVAVAGLRRWRWFVQRLTPEALALAADERLLLVLFALLALLNLAAAFSPVIFYDALVYHLNIPAEYLRAHRILLLPHNLHSNLPLGMSMLYLFTLPVPSGVPAQLLNCLFSLLAAGAAYVLARQWCERRRALLAMLLFQTLPVNALFATLLQADIGCAFYGLLALACLVQYRRTGGKALPLLAGVFAGVTLTYKYQSVLIVAVLTAFLLVPERLLRDRRAAVWSKFPEGQDWRRRTVALLAFWFTALLVFAPWLVKNYWLTGNPVFPAAYGLFGGGPWGPEQVMTFLHHSREQLGGRGKGWFETVLLVLDGEAVLGGHRLLFWTLLAALPLALVRRPAAGLLGSAALTGLLVWCGLTNRVDNILRYSLFLLALFGVAAALLVPDWSVPRRRWLCGAVLLFVTVELAAAVALNQRNLDSFTPVFTAEPRLGYLARTVESTPLLARAARSLPPSAKLLFIGEARGFYCQQPCLVPSAVDGFWLQQLFAGVLDTATIKARLTALGVTHIVLHAGELPTLRREFGYLDWRSCDDERRFYAFLAACRACDRQGPVALLAIR